MSGIGFIQRELDLISAELHQAHTSLSSDSDQLKRERALFIAQQALSWALEPTWFRSPLNTINGVAEASESRPPVGE